MEKQDTCPLAAELAAGIRDKRDSLASHWHTHLAPPGDAAPDGAAQTGDVLERITALLDAAADVIDDASDPAAAGDVLRERSLQLADLRFAQGVHVDEFLRDCAIISHELSERTRLLLCSPDAAWSPEQVHECTRRVFDAVSAVERAAAGRYARTQAGRIGECEERLRRLGRTVTHELKNRVGATLGAGQLLQEEWLGDAERIRFAGMVEENARAIQEAVEDLAVLSGRHGERRGARTLPLEAAVRDVLRQHRELARARDVRLRIDAPLPAVDVNASAFEIALSAYLSNAVKFSDPYVAERWADVGAALEGQPEAAELVVRVRDNGRGVTADAREHLFERFSQGRADAAGAGLGLSQVRKAVEPLGGRAWAELDQERGSVFAFSLPSPRERRNAPVNGNGAAARSGRPQRDPAPAKVSDSRP